MNTSAALLVPSLLQTESREEQGAVADRPHASSVLHKRRAISQLRKSWLPGHLSQVQCGSRFLPACSSAHRLQARWPELSCGYGPRA